MNRKIIPTSTFIFLVLAMICFIPQLVTATIYQPGETLEPDCAPGAPNCGVAAYPLLLGTTTPIANSLLTIAATSSDSTLATLRAFVGQSSSLFQVQNSNGVNFFSVGATGDIQIGTGAGVAAPNLLILDHKNTSGDPTGVNGAMYYNSSFDKFRCFENWAWRDCETGPRTATLNDTVVNTLTTSEAEILDGTAPSITPRATTNRIWITGLIRVTPPGGDTETNTFRIRRGSGDCSGTQAGADLTVITSVANISGVASINIIDSPATTAAQAYTVCGLTDKLTTPNTVPHIVLTLNEVSAAGADLAELYSTTDSSIEAGDVVAIDPTVEKGVLKTSGGNNALVLGIISTLPSFLLDDGVVGERVVQVAVTGRLPVKVNIENGVIHPGDYLAPSSVAGVAMKSSGVGPVIGQALSAFDAAEVGRVTAFVKNFDWGPEGNSNLAAEVGLAGEFCLKQSDGRRICVSGDQLASLIKVEVVAEEIVAEELVIEAAVVEEAPADEVITATSTPE